MGFFSELVSDLTHSGQGNQHAQQQPQSGYSGYPPQQSSPQPPPVSPPWYAEWDSRDGRWFFVNQQTGQRTFDYPGPGPAQQPGSYGASPQQGGYGGYEQGGYGQGGYGQGGYGQGGYSNQSASDPSRGSPPQEHKSGGNGWKYAAAGVAGLAGGALLIHESHKIEEGWDHTKERVDDLGDDVANFPENAAGWTGEQVGRVENFGDDVADFPENAAEWTGEKVQAVEDIPQDMEDRWDGMADRVDQFGDNMGNAYDQGRDERRYDDDYY